MKALRKLFLNRWMRFRNSFGTACGVQAKSTGLRSVAFGFSLLSLSALAHHGWSEYDASKTLKETGTIKESGYDHPHGFVKLEAAGKVWTVILAPPSRMESRGLPKDALKVGNTVTVEGYAHRKDTQEMRAERITAGGKTVELR